MSSRALRRLKGKQRGQEALDLGVLDDDEEEEEEEDLGRTTENEEPQPQEGPSKHPSGRKAKKNKTQKNISNMYELVSSSSVSRYMEFKWHSSLTVN